jgi:DNA-binding transcriptional ArsR family regulator
VVELLRVAPRRASELRDSGLVDVELLEDDGRGRVYRLRGERLRDLQAWLDQMEAFWAEQLGSFKAHAERRKR